jgi:hypothetical protein
LILGDTGSDFSYRVSAQPTANKTARMIQEETDERPTSNFYKELVS